jgi:hypothetical protein
MNNTEPKTWVPITEPLAAVQNLINAALLGQSKGAYTFEEASLVWESIKYLVNLQVKLREEDKDMNDSLIEELSKTELEEENSEAIS